MPSSRIALLGVPIDAITQAEALARMHEFLKAGGQHHIATPNNEMLVEASRNEKFRSVLQRTALNIPDSTGVVWMGGLPERVTGTDTMQKLCESIGPEHPVFLLGAGEGIAEHAAQELQRRNPRLKIAGTFSGTPRDEDAQDITQKINAASPHLLFVAYGAPAQDLWIDQHLKDMPSVRIAMGVGGALDFIAGVQKRAPSWMRAMGLEWVWRLVRQPSRLPRIINAVIVFPILCMFWRRNGDN